MNVKRSSGEKPLIELERFLPYRLNVAAEAVSSALSRIYAEKCGISIPEWRIVATLGQYGTMAARDIGEHSRMHKTKVSRAVAALMNRHLLTRIENSQDRREAFLALTEEGRRIYETIAPDALEFADEMLADLSESEREFLEKLLANLEARAKAVSDKRRKR